MNIPVCERALCSLWFIMDEGVLYGCHNSALSTATSQTVPLRGSSQFIIDHPPFPYLLRSAQDERVTMRKRNNKGRSWLLILSVFLWSLEELHCWPQSFWFSSWSFTLCHAIYPDLACCSHIILIIIFPLLSFLFGSQKLKCKVMRGDEIIGLSVIVSLLKT